MKKDITKMMIGAERLIAKSNNPRHIAILEQLSSSCDARSMWTVRRDL